MTIEVRNIEERQYFIQWEIGETANHMRYVKNAIVVFFSEL
jgi:hypothetical protein